MNSQAKMTPYPEYKATNLPWLPQIPAHWALVRNKNVLKEQKDTVGKYSSQYTLLSLTLSGIIPRDMENCKGKFPAEFDNYKIVRCSDIVFCLFDIDETPRAVGLSGYSGMITGAYDVFSITNVNPRFLYYYYLNIDNQKALKPYYTGLRKVVNIARFLSLQFPIPSVAEQEQIVRYLDSMTAKINKLIRAKKKQISLLQEQKQAIINQAVTKGLNPNAEMKDSGIDWLGQIPAHWKVNKIFRLFNKIGSGTTPPNELNEFYNNGTIPWVNSGDLYGIEKEIKNVQKKVTVRALEKFTTLRVYPENTIIIAMYGASIGNMGITQFPSCCNQACCCLATPQKELIIDFAYYVLLGCKKRWIEQSNGGGQSNINQDVIKQTWVAFPAIAEQNEIVYALSKRLQKYKFCLEKLRKEINILLEYKNSLIASVVTGQVDVRNIQVEDFDPTDLISETDDDPAEDESTAESEE